MADTHDHKTYPRIDINMLEDCHRSQAFIPVDKGCPVVGCTIAGLHGHTGPVLTADQSMKKDAGKPPMELVDAEFVEGVARVLGFGAKKYAAHKWRDGITLGRLLGAVLRHVFAMVRGEDVDAETGEPHAYHAACELMFFEWTRKRRSDLDDRYKT